MRCEDVLHPALWSVPFDELSAENVEEWITSHFADAEVLPNGPADFSWSTNGKGFHLHFDDTYQHIAQYPTDGAPGDPEPWEQEPTVADVLRCFGKPELYALQDIPSEVPQIRFSMWYLNRGMTFQTQESKGLIPRRFDLASRLHGPARVVPPGSAEEMAASWWTTDPDLLASLMAALKPWPEDFQVAE